jgi:plastocyanin
MSRIRIAVAAVLVALLAPASVSAGSAALPKLVGTVGTNDAFVITLTKSGKKVTRVKPGRYTVTVRDRSRIHNFRLKGPGLNKAITTVPFVGTKTVTVRLRAGKYTYDCDPHFASMHATFRVAA